MWQECKECKNTLNVRNAEVRDERSCLNVMLSFVFMCLKNFSLLGMIQTKLWTLEWRRWREIGIIMHVDNRAKDVTSVIIIWESWYNFRLYIVSSLNLDSVDLTSFNFDKVSSEIWSPDIQLRWRLTGILKRIHDSDFTVEIKETVTHSLFPRFFLHTLRQDLILW